MLSTRHEEMATPTKMADTTRADPSITDKSPTGGRGLVIVKVVVVPSGQLEMPPNTHSNPHTSPSTSSQLATPLTNPVTPLTKLATPLTKPATPLIKQAAPLIPKPAMPLHSSLQTITHLPSPPHGPLPGH